MGGDQGRGRPTRSCRSGGTITHHHAVGRDHRRWYDRQRPEPFAAALRAAKRAIDPAGILNPGVLIDPMTSTHPTYQAVIFDLGGVVFPSPFEAFDAYDHGNGLAAGHRARADPARAARPARGPRSNGASSAMAEFFAALEAEAARGRLPLDARAAHGHDRHRGFGPRPAMARAIDTHPRERAAHRRAHEQLARADDERAVGRTATRLGFDVIVESAVVGLRKPDPRIYELVLARARRRRAATRCSSTTSASTSSPRARWA